MKYLLAITLLITSLASAVAAPTAAPGAGTPRPLVRYLAATLHLRPGQTYLVQMAVRRAPLALQTPEQVAERLRPVLSAAQFAQYADLQNNSTAYQMLQRLAGQR